MPDVIIPTSDDVSGATPGTALVPLVTGEDEIMSQSWATMRSEAAAAATDTVPSASNIYPLLRDLLSAGANITLTDNDVAETITITGAAAGTPAAQRTRQQIIDLLVGDSAGDINFTRDGSGSTADLRGQLRADSVGLAELAATGTPSVANFLRGDNTWAVAVPPGPTTPPEKFETRSTTVPASAATTNSGVLLAAAGAIITAHTASSVTLAAGRYLVSVTGTQAAASATDYRAYPQFVLRDGTTAEAVSTSVYYRGAAGPQSFQLFSWLDLSAATELTPAWRRQEYESGQSDGAFTVGPAVVTVIPVGAGPKGDSVTLTEVADEAAAGSDADTIYWWPAS